ncbi:hypothetical protein F5Y18DRAFT_431984 [Xylariaceae sp. FL1019]|nr:hypothetical protein F5Y18DRAFT_431984 [Xylariaceae sp. FL1019]
MLRFHVEHFGSALFPHVGNSAIELLSCTFSTLASKQPSRNTHAHTNLALSSSPNQQRSRAPRHPNVPSAYANMAQPAALAARPTVEDEMYLDDLRTIATVMLGFPTRAAFQLYIRGPACQLDWDEFVTQWLGKDENWKIREPEFDDVLEWFHQGLLGNRDIIDESPLTYWCSIMLSLIFRSTYEPSTWGINNIHSENERYWQAYSLVSFLREEWIFENKPDDLVVPQLGFYP